MAAFTVDYVTSLGACVYDNGASGVGATLTNAGTQAAFVADGETVPLNSTVLVIGENAGIYELTTAGSVSVDWVLTRATNYDQPGDISEGDTFTVTSGTLNDGSVLVQVHPGPFTIGETQLAIIPAVLATNVTNTFSSPDMQVTSLDASCFIYPDSTKMLTTTPSTFYVTMSAGQTITNAATQLVQFNTASINQGTYFNTGTYIWTPPAGYYELTLMLEMVAPATAATVVTLYIRKNASPIAQQSQSLVVNTTSGISLQTLVSLNGTDTVSVYANVTGNGGGNLDIDNTAAKTYFYGKRSTL